MGKGHGRLRPTFRGRDVRGPNTFRPFLLFRPFIRTHTYVLHSLHRSLNDHIDPAKHRRTSVLPTNIHPNSCTEFISQCATASLVLIAAYNIHYSTHRTTLLLGYGYTPLRRYTECFAAMCAYIPSICELAYMRYCPLALQLEMSYVRCTLAVSYAKIFQ